MRLSLLLLSATAATALAGSVIWGCTDLFHSTDFGTPDAGSAPPPLVVDFCSWDQATALHHAQEACGRLLACEGGFGAATPNAAGECVKNALSAYDCNVSPNRPVLGKTRGYWDCLWRARTCSGDPQGLDVDTCVFGGAALGCGRANYLSCAPEVPDTRVECLADGGSVHGDPCVATGRTCNTPSNQLAVCTGSAAGTCARTGCEGDQLHACADGGPGFTQYDRGFNCGYFGGGHCVENDAGPACTVVADGGLETCDPTSKVECTVENNSSIASGCPSGAKETFNCGRLGLQCAATSGGDAWDVSRACQPPPASGQTCTRDQCSADGKLIPCLRGVPQQPIDCVGLGLGACTDNPLVGTSDKQATCTTK